jgi:uncharacterized protein (DUF58 family)
VNFLLKPIYRLYRLISGARFWVARRFTAAGVGVVIGLIATASMGADTDNTVAYQAFTLLASLLFLAVFFGWGLRVPFVVTRLLPKFGTVGEPLRYEARLKNLTSRTQSGLTLIEDLQDPRPSFGEWRAVVLDDQRHSRSFRINQPSGRRPFRLATVKESVIPRVLPKQEAEMPMELTPLRRGVLRFKGVTFARPDPLGLIRALARTAAPQTVLVLPRRYPLPPVALPGTAKYQEGGVAFASNVGQSDEFVALRDYRHGDPLRHIHWRSWARAGKPVVKEFEDEFFVRHALVLDTFTERPQSEVFEEAVSVAASFACTIQTQESLLDLLFVGPESFCFTAGRGLAHADQMLEVLASVRPCSERSFDTLEHLVLDHIGTVSGCVCVLLAWDEPRREFVRKLRALDVPVRVLVITDGQQKKKLDPGPLHDEPERFHVLETGRVEQDLARLR